MKTAARDRVAVRISGAEFAGSGCSLPCKHDRDGECFFDTSALVNPRKNEIGNIGRVSS
jgi:hypothetical protein